MRRILTCLLLIFSLFACQDRSTEDINAVKACFSEYKHSILSSQGKRAVKYVSQRTVDEYQKYVDWALYADRRTFKNLSIINKFQVLLIKHQIPLEQLRSMTGKDAFIYATNHDWISNETVVKTTITDIQLQGEQASAVVKIGEKLTSHKYQFIRENNQWKFDMIDTLNTANLALQALIDKQGVSAEQLIFSMIEAASGSQVSSTIWEPLLIKKP
ncbi:hypothetical protein EZV61_12875 [Corallincola luteus]|uniref:Lipoprotein n=1 Tax=Corallincola luteus TaxID=1775177 RepID=A0ABY2AIX5_9GAMM|nr:hypothetical protein [Corallincola luteus]TCI02685.1 hypothetical protein EZV61_12875 [Corallincola luteus]